MTGPDTSSTAPTSWRSWVRPAIVLPLIVAVIITVAVLTPENSNARNGDERLTTHSTNSLGARVLYEFAAPDLETRSAGQKMLLRMGPDNAARVKAKLREIRAELVKLLRNPARPA